MTLPWGTPHYIIWLKDLNAPFLVHCILLCRKFENGVWETSLIPIKVSDGVTWVSDSNSLNDSTWVTTSVTRLESSHIEKRVYDDSNSVAFFPSYWTRLQSQWRNWDFSQSSGVPKVLRARGQSSFWRPHSGCLWKTEWGRQQSLWQKNALGVQGDSVYALHTFVSRQVRRHHVAVISRKLRRTLGIRNYRRVKNLIVSREAILTFNFGHDSTFKQFYCDQDCGAGVGVRRSRRFLGEVRVGFLTTQGVGVGFLCPTPDAELDHF